jgi:H+/Cl- antiporter ClcA
MTKALLKWTIISIIVGLLVGVGAWAFFHSVNWAISFRKMHPWLVIYLPIVGVLVAWFYQRYGQSVDAGNNLILDEIHDPKRHIPFRMVPMIFGSSVLSHLFGASVGREGAAVQIGSGISDQFSKYFGKYLENRKIILMIGISAGFSSIFGAPIAGAVFGMEVLLLGSVTYEAIFPCFVTAIIGYLTASHLGMEYSHFRGIVLPNFSALSVFFAAVAGLCFGLVARFFIWFLHAVKDFLKEKCTNVIFRPFFGGLVIVISFYLLGHDRYLGLGEEVIASSFVSQIYPLDFLGKIFTTGISVGSGFRGGEVMSLFYIGATFGNALALILPLSFPLLAALGFVSVFAGASNAPIACIFLALRLFGSDIGVYAAIAIVVSYIVSGDKGLYHSQRRFLSKKLE